MPNDKYICMDCFKGFNDLGFGFCNLDFVIFSIIKITNNGPIYRCDHCGMASFEISIIHIKRELYDAGTLLIKQDTRLNTNIILDKIALDRRINE